MDSNSIANDIDILRAEASEILNGRHDCLPAAPALIGWAAQEPLRRHPGTRELDAVIAAERALKGARP